MEGEDCEIWLKIKKNHTSIIIVQMVSVKRRQPPGLIVKLMLLVLAQIVPHHAIFRMKSQQHHISSN